MYVLKSLPKKNLQIPLITSLSSVAKFTHKRRLIALKNDFAHECIIHTF